MRILRKISLFFSFLVIIALPANSLEIVALDVDAPEVVMQGVSYNFQVFSDDFRSDSATLWINGNAQHFKVDDASLTYAHVFQNEETISIRYNNQTFSKSYKPIPLWLSIIPPFIAILFALLFKEVFSALLLGIFSGAFIRYYFSGTALFTSMGQGFLRVVDRYIPNAFDDSGHISIIVFSMLIGGVVSLINHNGGMNGFVKKLSALARSARSTQFITWLLGVFIFFDDYANTLVVGNTMRPVSDKWKISREKLAYIVDSTAAPIASIAFVTTWIGAELSYIKEGLQAIGLEESPYSVFLHSIKYSFYPLLTLSFVAMLIWKNKDFGPMLKAQRYCHKKGINSWHPLSDKSLSKKTSAWYNGVIPVIIIITGTIVGLFYTGYTSEIWNDGTLPFTSKISGIIGNSDSYNALIWSSAAATLIALILTISQKLASLRESMEHLLEGYKSMLQAIIILILAWALAEINHELQTAHFIAGALVNYNFSIWMVPTLTFVLAVAISFSTGSSWGTMAILYPLIIPATWIIAQNGTHEYNEIMQILYNVISCVLAGAVLGDHISPISDTTIMSSLASSCNHIAHVKTQLPYALLVGFVSVSIGTLATSLGFPVVLSFVLGIIILFFIIQFFGKRSSISM